MYIDKRLIEILETHKGETVDVNFMISLIKTIAEEHETEQLLLHGVVVNEAEEVDKKQNRNIKPISKRPIDDCEDGSEVPFCQCKQPKMLGVEEIDRNRCKICKNPFW